MPINYQRSQNFNIQKITKTAQNISDGVSKINNEDLIEYLEGQAQKQQNRDKLILIINICTLITSITASIITIFK